ncbi:PKSN polyketide synthase for alternapyrone biosynthesis [Exophiala viscosa]|uniref:PKSN polyketide synthase for alternapyrone biosynthesis n=1 Tax=Exophiala viscosa TaxID=2486360 RepID=A0AAN6IK26_9EURO|nr:PKSN polyketide synthase for alternapyrone biosynthesis [Exophiala viscosa]
MSDQVNTKHGFFLEDDISLFDAPFFSITAKEASGMDPMQRLLLEVSYETFENAGIPMEKLVGSKTSVFCGCFTGDYDLLSNHDIFDHAPNAATGTGRAMLSNRVSWFFDLRGSSFTVDTACSSSLYALHSACQSLRLGESSQALVTGSNLALYPSMFHSLTNMHFLSPDGICHSFDDRANGYARGEAIGGLLLKPLSKALADGDTIRAVIRGSATNQDGKTPGITMPSPESQADLIRFVYAQAGLKMSDTSYFEAHGTGTGLGDPMELSAIGTTLGAAREAGQTPLYVGSIKSNIGHTEGCSGLAGVIKSVLLLEKGMLVPNAGFENLNPKLRLKDWNLALPLNTMAWPTSGLRRVSVNSFGYGGSNAHVIIDDAYHYLKSHHLIGNHSTVVNDDNDFGSDSGVSMGGSDSNTPPPEEEDDDHVPIAGNNRLLVFSSLDQAGLQRQAASYRSALSKTEKNQKLTTLEYLDQQVYLDDLANTLASRRTKFDYRSFAVADSTSTLTSKLSKGLPKLKRALKDNNIMMVFTGQGAQWAQMGRELLDRPVFREATAKSQAYLKKYGATWDVFTELSKGEDSRIDSPEFSQPICTVLQVSLVALLRHWGVTPKATVGHSSGEIGAAYAAGYLTHEDAIKIAYFRGVYSEDVARRLVDRQGIMMAAGVSEAVAQEYLQKATDGVAVAACINSPSSVTLSGDVSAINQLESMLTKDGKFARKLRVKTAYHSPHMQVIADDYLRAMGDIKPLQGNAGTFMYSSVTGKLASASDFDATYWVKNMVGSVRFSDAVSGLLVHSTSKSARRKTPVKWSAVIELGPHEALKGPVNQIMTAVDSKLSSNIIYMAPVLRGKNAQITALEAAGNLWCSGHSVDLAKVNGFDRQLATRKVLSDLPTYPWNHSKGFWYEPRMTTAKRFKKEPRTDLLGAPIDNQNDLEPHWRQILRISENPWMEHHEITGTILYPGAGMLIMAIEAARQLADPTRSLKGIELQDVVFGRGLVIPSGEEAVETSLSLRPHKTFPHTYSWTLYSLPAGSSSWVENSSGLVALIYHDRTEAVDGINTEWGFQSSTYEAIKKTSTVNINMDKFYKDLAAIGMGYGPSFRNLTESKAVPGTFRAHGVITIPETKALMPHQFEYPHLIHPATLDAIFHLLFAGFAQDEGMKESAVPVSMERMFIAAECPQGAGTQYFGYTEGTMADGRDLAGDIVLSDDQWSEPKVVISINARKVTSSGSNSDGASLDEIKRTAVPVWKEDFSFMEPSVVESFIQDNAQTASAQLALWLDRACHKDADLRVLFVADNISTDLQEIIRKFGPEEGKILRFRQLTVAAKDEAAIEEMKTLGLDNLLVKYQTIDLKASATEQNFAESAFDMILAGAAPAAGAQQAASSLKPLLAPNGKLIFTSTISEDPKDNWQAIFEDVGLVKVAVCQEPATEAVLAVGSAGTKEESAPQYSNIVFLKRDIVSAELETTMEKLSSQLKTIGIQTEVATLSAIEDVQEKGVISFLEAETPLVINWSSGELEQFKRLVLSTPYLIWITRGGQLIDSEALEFAPATGLLRTIRTEVPQITLPHIDLAPAVDLAAKSTTDLIMKVFNATARETTQTPEMEFVSSQGKVLIPRVVENNSFDREIELHSANVRPVMAPLHQDGRPLKLEIGSSRIRWVEDEEAVSGLASEDVEIKMSAVGLSSLDARALADASGAVVGREGTGVVTRIGSAVKRFSVGQEVAVLKAHSYRTHLRQDQSLVQALPAKVSPVEAAALPTTYSAAYYGLVDLARVSSTDKVLIQAGSSGLGYAAVQIALWKGADIFVTADPTATPTLVAYGIPADQIFDERSDYKVQLQHIAGPLDVIFSATSGKPLRDLCALIKDFGRFVNVSSEATTEQLCPTLFARNVSFTNMDLERLFSSPLMSRLLGKVFSLLDNGFVGPIPTTAHSVSRLQEVVSSFEGAHGVTVLRLDQDAVVSTAPLAPPALKLDPEATYVLSGGLGGLGPNIASTMYEAGARHLVFLSRSGARTPEQKAVLKKLQAGGCKADALACDVSDANDMRKAMDTAARNGWKIKGVIQCAMVLRDSVLENMTYDKWVGATTCKIPGTWNLHAFLPEDMDFFIVLSSVVSVIGNTGQANYSAGNSYLDALAHYRHNKGLAATSLNIGLVTDATHFTEDFTIENFLQLYGHLVPVSVEDKEVNIALTAAMRGVTSDGVKVPTQVVVGIRGDLDREGSVTSLWPKDRKFDHRAKYKGTGGGDGKVPLKTILANAKSIGEAAEAVESALRSSVATSMGSSPDEVDVDKPLHSFGIDSLKAVEVRNWLFREAKADISVFEILSPTPLNVLSTKIAAKSKALPADITKQAAEELQE